MMNGAKAIRSHGTLEFTYLDSYGEAITEVLPELTCQQICNKIMGRMYRFKEAGPGIRESEISRAERKWISAHPLETLKKVWSGLDHHGQMEMSMMLSKDSHYGISNPDWAEEHMEKRKKISGDDLVPL